MFVKGEPSGICRCRMPSLLIYDENSFRRILSSGVGRFIQEQFLNPPALFFSLYTFYTHSCIDRVSSAGNRGGRVNEMLLFIEGFY